MAKMTKKKAIALIILVLFLGVALLLRGPHTSNFLKSLVLPELQRALGLQVISKKMHLNLLPLYVEAEEVKAFDENGERAFAAESVKAYIGLSGLLRKELVIDSLVVRKPQFWIDRDKAAGVAASLKGRPGAAGKGAFKLKFRTIVLRDGDVSYYDSGLKGVFEARGLDAEVILRERPEVVFSVPKLKAALQGRPVMNGSLEGNFFVGGESVEIKRLSAALEGSTLNGSGEYFYDRTGFFRLDLDVPFETVKKFKGLEKSGYGSVSARGTLSLKKDYRESLLDFDLTGDFYLETLLEALKARPGQELTGLVSFDGRMEGTLFQPVGEARARLRKANLYSLEVDDVDCMVSYADSLLKITDGKARLYGGRGDVDVTLVLPSVKDYTIEAEFKGVDSPPAFERIGLTWLGLPAGKVEGRLYTSGTSFDPDGWFSYVAGETRDDPIGRFTRVSGKYSMKDGLLSLRDMEASSAKSRLSFFGSLDTRKDVIDFKGDLYTDDIRELSTPYFGRLSGRAEFHGGASGPAADPLIKGTVLMHNAFLDQYPLGEVSMEASYRKNLFSVRDARAVLKGVEYSGRGEVAFPGAAKLLDFAGPEFGLTLNLRNADLGGLLRLNKISQPIEGRTDGEITISGRGIPLIRGKAEIEGLKLWDIPVASATLEFSYDFEAVGIENAVLRNGDSKVELQGRITKEGEFSFTAGSESLHLKDAVPWKLPLDYKIAFEAQGRGTAEKPVISLRADLLEGTFRDWPAGSGTLEASLEGKVLSFHGKVVDKKVGVAGEVSLGGEMPWKAELEFDNARFDFLAATFMKEMPEDTLFSMTGRVALAGSKDHLEANAVLRKITFALYGQSFTNDEEILLTLKDGLVETPGFELRSGTTSVNVEGSLKYKESFDVLVYGNSSLAPLKGFSEKITLLSGKASFVLALQGRWDRPTINGGFDVTGGALGLRDIPQRLGEIKGFSYFEGDTLVIETLDAKLGGGDIEVSGIVKFEGLHTKTASLDMLLKDVNLSLTKGLKLNVGGNLIYRSTPESRILTGEVALNRAEYRDRIEWKSWLLKARRARAAALGRKGPYDDVDLSIGVYGDEGIIIDNNVARANLEIDVVLRGTVGEPRLIGRIAATEGKFYFRNSEFDIVRATADFSDVSYTEPYVDIVAETTAKGYHIWLNLEGKPEQLDMALASDPDLGEEEILSLITVGAFGERLQGLEGGIGAAEASSALTGGFQDVVEERIRDLTGVSRFTIDPYVSRKTGSITPRVTVSKRLAGDIFVTFSSTMSTSEEPEIKLEYRINRNVSLIGGQDDLGTLGGDVRFRFFFK
jgi:hypothetical protein